MTTGKPLVKHLLSCYACKEDYFVLSNPDSEAIPIVCPFCGSTEIGDYGTDKPADTGEEEQG